MFAFLRRGDSVNIFLAINGLDASMGYYSAFYAWLGRARTTKQARILGLLQVVTVLFNGASPTISVCTSITAMVEIGQRLLIYHAVPSCSWTAPGVTAFFF
jgi:hypothetical protein